jgi:hypothetical protein
MAHRRTHLIGASAAALVAATVGASGGAAHVDAAAAPGPPAARAIAAALMATNGGTANSVERDTEDGATWEVEVSTPHGTRVDVRLDSRYRVVVIDDDLEDGGR